MNNSKFLNKLYLMRLSKRQFELSVLFMWFYSINSRRKKDITITLRIIKHYLGIGASQAKDTLEQLVELNILTRIDKKINGKKQKNIQSVTINSNGYIYKFNDKIETYALPEHGKRHLNDFSINTFSFVKRVTKEIKEVDQYHSGILVSKFVELYKELYDTVYMPVWGRDRAHMKRLIECFEKNGYASKDVTDYFEWLTSTEGKRILRNRRITALSTGILRSISSEYLIRRKKEDKVDSKYDEDEDGHRKIRRENNG